MADKDLQFALTFRDNVSASLRKFEQSMSGAGSKAKTFGEEVKGAGAKVDGFSDRVQNMQSAVQAAFAAFAAAQFVRSSVGSFADFELALIGVGKTTNATAAEIQELDQRFTAFSQSGPVAREQLAGIAQIAGQLGVRGVQNLDTFAQTIAKVTTATDLMAEDAAFSFQRLLKATGEPTENVAKLGSQMVSLGNNIAARESEIVSVARELGIALAPLGVGLNEIVAISGQLADLAIPPERARTAFQQLFTAIEIGAVRGGEELKLLAKLAGETPAELQRIVKTQGTFDAFKLVMRGLKTQLEGTTTSAATASAILEQLGLTAERGQGVFVAFAKSMDRFEGIQGLVNAETNEAIALNTEYAKFTKALTNEWAAAQNAIKNAAGEVGEGLSPAIFGAVGLIKDLATGIRDTLEVLGPFEKGLAAVAITLASFVPALIAIAPLLPAMKAGFALLGVALAPLFSTTGLLVAGVAAAAAGFAWLNSRSKEWQGTAQDDARITSDLAAKSRMLAQEKLAAAEAARAQAAAEKESVEAARDSISQVDALMRVQRDQVAAAAIQLAPQSFPGVDFKGASGQMARADVLKEMFGIDETDVFELKAKVEAENPGASAEEIRAKIQQELDRLQSQLRMKVELFLAVNPAANLAVETLFATQDAYLGAATAADGFAAVVKDAGPAEEIKKTEKAAENLGLTLDPNGKGGKAAKSFAAVMEEIAFKTSQIGLPDLIKNSREFERQLREQVKSGSAALSEQQIVQAASVETSRLEAQVRSDLTTKINEQIESLRLDRDLVGQSDAVRDRARETQKLLNEVKKQGIDLTKKENEQLAQRIAQLPLEIQLTKEAEKRQDLIDSINDEIAAMQAEAGMVSLTAREREVAERVLRAEAKARQDGVRDIETYIAALEEEAVALQLAQDNAERGLAGVKLGAANALDQITDDALNTATATQEVLTGIFNGVSDNLAEMVTTGKANWKDFATSTIKEINRIIIRMFLLWAIQKAVGLIGAAASGGGSALSNLGSGFGNSAGGGVGVPVAAEGLLVKKRKGGTLVRVGEGGDDEFIAPLRKAPALIAESLNRSGGAGMPSRPADTYVTSSVTVNVSPTGQVSSERKGDKGQAEELSVQLERAVQKVVLDMYRPGNSLNPTQRNR